MDNDLPDTRPFANFEWMLALRYLRARRKESFISVISLFSFLGIMLGVATLIVVMAVLNGFRAELLDKILGFSGHASFYHQDLSPIPDFKEVQARLEKVDGVKRVISLVEGQAMASSLRSSTGVLVRGIAESDIRTGRDLLVYGIRKRHVAQDGERHGNNCDIRFVNRAILTTCNKLSVALVDGGHDGEKMNCGTLLAAL